MSSFLKPITSAVKEALLYFKPKLQDADSFNAYLISRGWISNVAQSDITTVQTAINIIPTINNVVSLIQKIERSEDKVETVVGNAIPVIKTLFSTIKNLSNVNTSGFSLFPLNQSVFWSELGANLFDDILIDYLYRKQNMLYAILHLSGIITKEAVQPTGAGRIPYQKNSLQWDRLGDLLTDPTGLLKDTYSWGNNIDYDKLFIALKDIFNGFGTKPTKTLVTQSQYNTFFNGYNSPNTILDSLEIPLYEYEDDNNKNDYRKVSVSLLPAYSPITNQITGIMIVPNVLGIANFDIPIGTDFKFKGEGYFSSDNSLGLMVYPDGTSKLISNANNLALGAKMSLIAIPIIPWTLLGDSRGTRLILTGAEASLSFLGTLNDPEMIFKIGMGDVINKNNFVFIYDPSTSDGFIKKILGESKVTLDFGASLRWSSKHGIGFEGSAGLSIAIPLQKKGKANDSKFPIQLETLRINANVGTNNGASLSVGLDFNFEIKVIKVSVTDIGAKLSLKKKQNTEPRGILGDLDLDFAFKPPTGAGIAIDITPIKGGGFLQFNQETSMYAGGLELKLGDELTFKAIGIIHTKLPGGQKGFALLIVITAEFSPINLGMGFTLNGLGGIMGLNRTMDPDFLRKGIREKTLDSILFPKDVIKNASTIISNLNQAFPLKEGQFLVGPMAKIGWSTPNIITIDLGIIIEFPEPVRLAILGVLRALVPPGDPVLTLQINFLGIIDFTNKYLSFDASLFDSSILAFTLSGDMALRLYWGDKPNFLVSVGGFHPKYTPPPLNLPELRRLSLSLSSGKPLTISVETYFALTSNSVQFGARVYACAKAGCAMVEGALWFDILFQFSPFYFIADMGVMFAVKVGGSEIMSIFVDLSLEGPNPWHAQGKGTFKILFVKLTARFDKTFGSVRPEAIEAVETFGKMQEAIGLRDNWQALLPARNSQLVAYREAPASDNTLQVDPAGTLVFSQKVLPLGIELQKFGTAAIKDFNKYALTLTSNYVGGVLLFQDKVTDFFARNEFFNMKDEEKLSKDSFEKFESGMSVTAAGVLQAGPSLHRKCHYEEIFIDGGIREKKTDKWELSLADFEKHHFAGYVSQSPLSKFEKLAALGGPQKTSVKEGKYKIADKNTFTESSGNNPAEYFDNYTMAENHLKTIAISNPTAAADLLVAHEFELA